MKANRATSSDNQRHVFVVDDSADILDLFTYLAEINGFDLMTAQNGFEALAKIASLTQEPSTLFVDLNMPIMNGTEFLIKLKDYDLAKTTRIVILSGAERPCLPPMDFTVDWLRKPFSLTEILKTINLPAKTALPVISST